MVLLDVGDGECDAVELEIGDAGGDFADEGLGSIIQLHSNCADFFGAAGELLSWEWYVSCGGWRTNNRNG